MLLTSESIDGQVWKFGWLEAEMSQIRTSVWQVAMQSQRQHRQAPSVLRDLVGRLHRIHLPLFGRYRWTGLCGVTGAVIGIMLGCFSLQSFCRSTGFVSSPPVPRKILFDQEIFHNNCEQPIGSCIQCQLVPIRCRQPTKRTINKNQLWQMRLEVDRPDSKLFTDHIEVTRPHSEGMHVSVAFSDPIIPINVEGDEIYLTAYAAVLNNIQNDYRARVVKRIDKHSDERRQYWEVLRTRISSAGVPTSSDSVDHPFIFKGAEEKQMEAWIFDVRSLVGKVKILFRASAVLVLVGFTGLVGVLIVVLLNNRMMRPHCVELDTESPPLLGTIPNMLPDDPDPRDYDLTALCVHEIRARLQIGAKSNCAQAFAVTSSTQGSGKTSLAVALAYSLALSGTKTLLIDCDLVGRTPVKPSDRDKMLKSMATQCQDRPMIQSVEHASVDSQSESNMSSKTRSDSIGQAMLQMGYLNEVDAELFVSTAEGSTGLRGVLSGLPLDRCVIEGNVSNLDILPSFSSPAHDIGKLSGQFIRRLINEARSHYGVILFDTGPIPGSVETLFVASEVDGVVVVASRGEGKYQFKRTLSTLRIIGAQLVGTVFNKATRQSVNLMGDVQAYRDWSVDAKSMPPSTHRVPVELLTGSGILAAAVQGHAMSGLSAQRFSDSIDTVAVEDNALSEIKIPPEIQEQSAETVGSNLNGQVQGTRAMHAKLIQKLMEDAATALEDHFDSEQDHRSSPGSGDQAVNPVNDQLTG